MTPRVNQRRDPDQLLKQVEAEERDMDRGRLKVFLGYASGVGKSFRMLDEGRPDLVVAFPGGKGTAGSGRQRGGGTPALRPVAATCCPSIRFGNRAALESRRT